MENMDIKVAVRNKGISDMLCFKRYGDSNDLIAQILYMRQEGKDLILALDGEFFGHHYKEGIFFLNTFVDELTALDINLVTVSELIEKNDAVPLKKVIESTWGASMDQVTAGNSYPLWDAPGNELHKLLWELQKKVVDVAEKDGDDAGHEGARDQAHCQNDADRDRAFPRADEAKHRHNGEQREHDVQQARAGDRIGAVAEEVVVECHH